jgi:hypothetical protein
MANDNPIRKTSDGGNVEYKIPAQHANKNLFISIESSLKDAPDGWLMDLLHSVLLRGKSINPIKTQDPKRLQIGKNETCADLNNSKFRIISRITRIRDGGEDPHPDIQYKITFEVNNGNLFKTLDSFDASWDNEDDMAKFVSKITFKI